MKYFSFLILVCVLFLFSCGGNRRGAAIASPITGPIADAEIASNAAKDSPWSLENFSTPTSSENESANTDIQEVLSSILSEQEENIDTSSKSQREFSREINRTITGPRGGTAIVKGLMDITTTTGAIFPLTTTTEATINFEGYDGSDFSLHGESEYSGTRTFSSRNTFERHFTTHGGYSYKGPNGIYSFVTTMDVTIHCVDGVRTGTYTFTINGETTTGSF